MASSKEYLDFILEQLSGLEGITFKPMMGEYILYMHDRIFGGMELALLDVFPLNSRQKRRPNQIVSI